MRQFFGELSQRKVDDIQLFCQGCWSSKIHNKHKNTHTNANKKQHTIKTQQKLCQQLF